MLVFYFITIKILLKKPSFVSLTVETLGSIVASEAFFGDTSCSYVVISKSIIVL